MITVVVGTVMERADKQSKNGNAYADLTVKDVSSGKTMWVHCLAFGRLDYLANVRKGSVVVVYGDPETSSYTGKDGKEKKRYTVMVHSVTILSGEDKGVDIYADIQQNFGAQPAPQQDGFLQGELECPF